MASEIHGVAGLTSVLKKVGIIILTHLNLLLFNRTVSPHQTVRSLMATCLSPGMPTPILITGLYMTMRLNMSFHQVQWTKT